MALPPIHGQQNFKPATETSTGGALARKFKQRKKDSAKGGEYTPHPEALASLEELKRERGLD